MTLTNANPGNAARASLPADRTAADRTPADETANPELADLRRRLNTVIGIPVVPYDEDGAVDLDLTAALTRRLVQNGVTALTPNGNTGEFYALSPRERRDVLAVVIGAAQPETVIIAGVGFDLDTAVSDARFARDAGAHAIMVHQPVLPYLSPGGWVDYVTTVAQAVPELGVLPYVSSTLITGADVASLADRAPNVIGLKYSVPDPAFFATTRHHAGGDLLWIAGLAESYAPAYWSAGARAFTSGLVNVSPRVSLDMFDALARGDAEAANDVWRDIRLFEELRARNRSADNVSVVKEAMHQLGLCLPSVRPPSRALTAEGAAEVARSIAAWPALAEASA
ncbi:dihydrodipicolinate synthase family protein [Okibacterium fritillariae]|uniref:4-hydroxy-tetrahydrodipicolinate synthase n=1 Tax=Okibacterium fritillariae TaxID=123320 RepID=A0A1T5IA49_9MICO|nr:dihydrodipicolinate synthase family protein [Okibacterium fritillariae]SKC36055.1 4-hydroxy-tetrahydrodipicolinate synthase [Okibacterium fritillariae]